MTGGALGVSAITEGTTPAPTDMTLVSVRERVCVCGVCECDCVCERDIYIYLSLPGVLQKHKWENAMTIDRYSWGFRREATIDQYLSIQELVSELVITVRWAWPALHHHDVMYFCRQLWW